MEERHIASVDLGTSKIALSIAKVVGEDVQVVYYKESPSQGIRNSYVINPHKVETELRKAVQEAQQELKIRIQQAIVGLPRYEVRQETATARTTRAAPPAEASERRTNNVDSANDPSFATRRHASRSASASNDPSMTPTPTRSILSAL